MTIFKSKILMLLVVGFVLVGCSSETVESMRGKIKRIPEIPLEVLQGISKEAKISFLSESDVPIDLQIIYLSEDSKLNTAYYSQIADNNSNLKEMLGNNYVDHQDYTIYQNEFKVLPRLLLNPKVTYIGIVAYYPDLENNNDLRWKKIIRVRPNMSYNILIHLSKNKLDVRYVEDR